MKFFKYHW